MAIPRESEDVTSQIWAMPDKKKRTPKVDTAEISRVLAECEEISKNVLEGQKGGNKGAADMAKKMAFPIALSRVDFLFELVADKKLQAAASKTLFDIAEHMPEYATRQFLKRMRGALHGLALPEQKKLALSLLDKFATDPKGARKRIIAQELVNLVPAVAPLGTDLKVKHEAEQTMRKLFRCCENADLIAGGSTSTGTGFEESVIKGVHGQDIPGCVETLAGCLFVQRVESPALSVMLPIFLRGLNSDEKVVRRTCVIIENMAKLVDEDRPEEAFPLTGAVLAALRGRTDTVSDPEARGVVERVVRLLEIRFLMANSQSPSKSISVLAHMRAASLPAAKQVEANPHLNEWLNEAALSMLRTDTERMDDWDTIFRYAHGMKRAEIKILIVALKGMINLDSDEQTHLFGGGDDDGDMSQDLFRGSFSLAFGSCTLIKDTPLLLKKNRFYGLLGANGCGKTSLMRAIVEEKLEGFPKRDKLTTVFVEHDIGEEPVLLESGSKIAKKSTSNGDIRDLVTTDLSGTDWVYHTVRNVYGNKNVTKQDCAKALAANGFGPGKAADHTAQQITEYSGGWKMKMQLVAATLVKADILMLDEPTAHIDAANTAWMSQWLAKFPGSVVVTSHNIPWLNERITDLIYFENRKLRQFHGEKGKTVDLFAQKFPDKLEQIVPTQSESQAFELPPPGPLDGVSSKTKAVLKMQNVSFKYPHRNGTPAKKNAPNVVNGVSLNLCLNSRVSVVGPNGAGKSTLMSLLLGEEQADTGTVLRHSGLRIAHVAQQALHHLEKHLDKTPNKYMQWRFEGMDDRENFENRSKAALAASEAELQKVQWMVQYPEALVRKCEGNEKPWTIHQVLGRKKGEARAFSLYDHVPAGTKSNVHAKVIGKSSYEYSVQFLTPSGDKREVWVPRDVLIQMGHEKLACREDERQAAEKGLMQRPLIQSEIEKHLASFGLDAEIVSHTPIAKLAAGQRARLALGAALWLSPHILVLDEPTNYLDKRGQKALVKGLQSFGGGVIVVSHNEEFCAGVASEFWRMTGRDGPGPAGTLKREGELAENAGPQAVEYAAKLETMLDASGNTIEVSKGASVNKKELKRQIRELEGKLKKKSGGNKLLTEDLKFQIMEKVADLKEQLTSIETGPMLADMSSAKSGGGAGASGMLMSSAYSSPLQSTSLDAALASLSSTSLQVCELSSEDITSSKALGGANKNGGAAFLGAPNKNTPSSLTPLSTASGYVLVPELLPRSLSSNSGYQLIDPATSPKKQVPPAQAAMGNTDRQYTGNVADSVANLSPAMGNGQIQRGVAPAYEYKKKNDWMEG
ncbi:unnamed protein product [Amoebophrya sp. A25]|nr:unnamed protein product [Amoebophrya sp. A25]|eukprot:GSA25T00011204001.1